MNEGAPTALYGVDKTISFVEWNALFLICQLKEYLWSNSLKKYGTRNLHSKKKQSRVTQANTDQSLSIITVVFVLGLK